MRTTVTQLCLGTAGAALTMPGQAWAQSEPAATQATPAAVGADAGATAAETPSNGLADIIVTATKTGASRLQDTPLPISAFTSDQLDKTLTSNIKDLAQFTPSLNVSLATTNPVITLRGIGTNNVQNGSDPDVTMQIDGVYIARPSAMGSDFIDVARVEVLRGPQGTLYGRNAIGGTINIISLTPTDELTGRIALTGGNYALFQGQGYVSGALVPGKLQASLSATYTRHNDYEKNLVPGVPGVNNANHGGVRGQLRFEPTDSIDATTRVDYVFQREHLQALYQLQVPFGPAPLASSIVGNYTKVAINTPSRTYQRGFGVAEEINFHLTDQLTLKSLSAFRQNRYDVDTDNDGTELNSIVGHFTEHQHQITQEFDLNGKFGGLDAVVGGYYFNERASTNVYAQLYGPGVKINSLPHFKDESYAGFGQGTYHVTPTLNVTAGIRYTTERKDIDSTVRRTFFLTTGALLPGFPILIQTSRRFHAWTPKFGVDWKVTPDVLLYATVTRGYKSGGTNYAATSLATSSFDPEHLWSYEGGFKADLIDRHLRLNLTAFHYDYTGLQLQSVLVPGVVTILNAATARVDGVELETTAKLTSTFRIDANLSALRAKYRSFSAAPVANALGRFEIGDPRFTPNPVAPPGVPGSAGGSYNASGNRLNQAPKLSGTVAVENDFPLASGATITARGDVYFQGRVFYEATNSRLQSQGAYALLNAQLGYTSPNKAWSVRLFGKNLIDKHYLIAFQANGVVPAGTGSAPRTFGIRLEHSW